MKKDVIARLRRHRPGACKISGTPDRPRLNVFRSLGNIYAQVIDDVAGHTLVSASTIDRELRGQVEGKNKTEAAKLVGAVGRQARPGSWVSSRSCLTAAATGIMAGSRPWPMARAKPGWSSK